MSARADQPEYPRMPTDTHDDIALVGIGLRLPGADNPTTFFQNLVDGVDAIRPIPAERTLLHQAAHARNPADRIPNFGGFLEGVDRFDAQFFGFSRKEVLATDPQHRLMLHVAWEALEDAAIDPRSLRGRPVAIYTGVIGTDYHDLLVADAPRFDLYGYVNTAYSALAGRVAYALDTRAEAVSVDTACSSSLVAMHLGVSALRRGDADVALVGGANVLLVPEFSQAFTRAGMLAADGRCKAFDARGDGFVRSEGVVCVALMPLARAREGGHPIYAVVKGTRLNHDGGTGHYKTPNVAGQTALLRGLYRSLGLDPRDTHYVEAHGTGTRAGDPVEIEAIANVLCEGRSADSPLLVGSVKSQIGHCEGAAGLAGVVKVALALKHGVIPGNLHFEEPNPNIAWDRMAIEVASRTQPWPVKPGQRARAGVSAFGLTGVNAHVLLEQWVEPPSAPRSETPSPLVWAISDPSDTGLRANVSAQLDAWEREPDVSAQSLTLTAAAHRPHFEYRVAFVGDGAAELRTAARQWLDRVNAGERAARPSAEKQRVAFVFPGQGAQWIGMAREMLPTAGAFTDTLRRADEAISREAGFSVIERLTSESPDALDDIAVLQPTLFALQVAFAALWESWGIVPDAVVGHSMGETAAACVAGVLSLDDAVAVICRRSRLMRRLRGRGAMLLVELSRDDAAALVRGREALVAIAVNNGPTSTVLSGDPEALKSIAAELDARGVFCRQVKVDVASHSPQVDPIAEELVRELADLTPSAGRIAIFSTVRPQFGRRPEDGARFTADYWWENLRNPVLFADAIEAMLAHGIETFVEISSHPLLCQSISHSRRRTPQTLAVPTLRRGETVRGVAMQSLAELYTRGAQVAWASALGEAPLTRLPRRVWLEESYPVDFTRRTRRAAAPGAPNEHPWLSDPWSPPGRDDEAVFRTRVSLDVSPWLVDHQVQNEVIFPAAGYLELAASALRRLFSRRTQRVELRNVTFSKPLFLDAERGSSLELLVRHEGGGAFGSFEFYGRSGAPDAQPQRLAAGEFGWSADTQPRSLAPVVTPPTGSADALYAAFQRVGMEYGPAFRGVSRVERRDEGSALAALTAPPEIADELGDFAFHPALLDAAFQSCLAALADVSNTYLPVSLGSLQVLSNARRSATVSSRVKTTDAGFEADLRIVSDEGELLAEIKGLRADALRRTESEVLRELAYELTWSPSDGVEARSIESGVWLVFCDASGVGRRIAERFARASHRVVQVERGHRDSDTFRFDEATRVAHLNDERPEHWDALLTHVQQIAREGLRGVVYLWGLDATLADDAGADEAEAATLSVTWPIIELQQRAATRSLALGRLWIVTQNAFTQGSPGDVAVMSSLWGLGRVLDNELPQTLCTRVDLDDRNEPTLLALCDEVLYGSAEREIRLGRDARHVARLRRGAAVETNERSAASEVAFVLEWTPKVALFEALPESAGPSEVTVGIERALVHRDGDARSVQSCIGRVLEVGADVDALRPGDLVQLFGSLELRSHVTLAASDAVKLPEGLSPDVALTSSAHYAVATYALERLASAGSGDRVLVIGDDTPGCEAAVAAARAHGLRVALVTSGTRPGNGATRAAVSLSNPRWPTEVRALFEGRGVDVVLSLKSSLPRETEQILHPLARVIHLGTGSRVSHLLANVTYARADLAVLWRERRGDVREHLSRALRGIASGQFEPLAPPTHVASLRSLAESEPDGDYSVTVAPGDLTIAPARHIVRSDGAYVITGGAGGLGVSVAEWLIKQGARDVLLLGRRGPDDAARAIEARLSSRGARVRVARCDVSDDASVRGLFEGLTREGVRVRGVIHAAGVLSDGIVHGQSRQRFRDVYAPKVRASWALHRAIEQLPPVDFFVVFSSAASVLGTPGQCNYAAANAFMDGLTRARRWQRKPSQSMQWGPWAQVGLAALQDRGERLAQRGLVALRPEDGARAFGAALASRYVEVMLSRFDARAWMRTGPADHAQLTLSALTRSSTAPPPSDPHMMAAVRLRVGLAQSTDEATGAAHIEEYLKTIVGSLLGRTADRISASKPLSGLGVDSLMAVELRTLLEAHLAIAVSVVALLRGPSLHELAKSLYQQHTRRRSTRPPVVSPMTSDRTLGAQFKAAEAPKEPLGRSVLLTGATGFLGIYLVDALARQGVERIDCVVRARSPEEASLRLRAHAAAYGFEYDDFAAKVRAHPGDLGEARLGMSEPAWQSLAAETDAVIHNGANVNFLFDYDELRQENVLSTKEILALACTGRPKSLHYVSTWAVFGAPRYASATIDEGAMPEEPPVGGYAQTKFVSEHMLAAARERGVTASIYRPSLVGWDDATGRYNPREAFVRLLSTCLATRCVPDVDFVLPITPVRFVAEQIVRLAACDAARNGAYHPTTDEPIGFRALMEALRREGHALDVVPWGLFRERAMAQAEASGFPAFGKIFPEHLSSTGTAYIELITPERVSRFTTERARALLPDAPTCPTVSPTSIRALVDRLRRDDLLTTPAERG